MADKGRATIILLDLDLRVVQLYLYLYLCCICICMWPIKVGQVSPYPSVGFGRALFGQIVLADGWMIWDAVGSQDLNLCFYWIVLGWNYWLLYHILLTSKPCGSFSDMLWRSSPHGLRSKQNYTEGNLSSGQRADLSPDSRYSQPLPILAAWREALKPNSSRSSWRSWGAV